MQKTTTIHINGCIVTVPAEQEQLYREALNHIEKDNRITDIYIQKDFSIINEVNKSVIEYVFE